MPSPESRELDCLLSYIRNMPAGINLGTRCLRPNEELFLLQHVMLEQWGFYILVARYADLLCLPYLGIALSS